MRLVVWHLFFSAQSQFHTPNHFTKGFARFTRKIRFFRYPFKEFNFFLLRYCSANLLIYQAFQILYRLKYEVYQAEKKESLRKIKIFLAVISKFENEVPQEHLSFI